MNFIPESEKLAVLLKLLGGDAVDAALEKVDPKVGTEVKKTLNGFRTSPPSLAEVEYVVDDFNRYFRLAMDNIEEETAAANEDDSSLLQIAEENFEVELEPVKKFIQPKLTGDVLTDLNRMHPYQVAHAIRNDNPTTISLVVRNLATEHAAKTIEFLPETVRPAVFLQLAQPPKALDLVSSTILDAALQGASQVEERQPVEDTIAQMSTLIRSVPKSIRKPMLEELIKTNEELGNSVKSQLFRFDDVMTLSDRDMQQVLGKVSSDALVLALQGADPDLINRIFNNMSKRARESLQEEMSFKTNVKEEEVEVGRTEVVKVLVELDESGAISLG